MTKSKGTNSLAFARTDCHTCVSAARTCDRRRPQCSTCRDLGIKCGGFATPLSWDNNRIWLGQSSQKKVYFYEGNRAEESPRPSPSRTFRFVNGNARRKRRRRLSPSPHREQQRVGVSPGQGVDIESYLPHPSGTFIDEFDPLMLDDHEPLDAVMPFSQDYMADWMFTTFPVQGSQDPMSLPAIPLAESDSPEGNIFSPTLMGPSDTIANRPSENNQLTPSRFLGSPGRQSPPVTGTELIPNQIGSQNEILFQMYDTELCVLPLTSDVAFNPFRCRRQTLQASRLLFHAILALCCQHQYHLTGTWSEEASEHRNRASELLDSASKSDQVQRMGLHVLEPILIMFTLDCTVSAAGPWSKHLMRVRSILDACGGPLALNTSRVRSQVGMLFWWDATLALISRQGTFIDQSYLEHLTLSQGQDEWSFYDLTGCPGDLFVHLAHLAELAKQRELAAQMTYLSFDLSPVDQIEREIQNWTSPLFTDGYSPSLDSLVESPADSESESDLEEQFHSRQDRYHCAEAWRHALLIYIERVFRWDRERARPAVLNRLVRKTLDHVRCCRQTSQTQKQLLLPVFLAGSETGDEEMRRFTREYCQWWANRSRYNMFNSAALLLDEIWEREDAGAWWGSVVDLKSQGTGGEAAFQFLLG